MDVEPIHAGCSLSELCHPTLQQELATHDGSLLGFSMMSPQSLTKTACLRLDQSSSLLRVPEPTYVMSRRSLLLPWSNPLMNIGPESMRSEYRSGSKSKCENKPIVMVTFP